MNSRRRKIGFLGGGQLARMMILEAHRMGHEAHVLVSNLGEPAAQVTPNSMDGKLSDIKDLESFLHQVDLVTFESEFVPAETLKWLSKQPRGKVFPDPEIMLKLQNRASQKKTLQQFKIPTAAFVEVSTSNDLKTAWNLLSSSTPSQGRSQQQAKPLSKVSIKSPSKFSSKSVGATGFVLKKNFGGYDGYGTFFAKKVSDLKNLEEKLQNEPQGFIAEQMIPFKREVAAIFVRSATGRSICLPLVETHQTNGRCDWVRGPLTHPRWLELQKRIFQMMKSLGYVGALGVEMFDTGHELLVNELAPRVHNSGHYSQDALLENQFALHLRAGLGDDLNPAQILAPQFVMTNLLGQSSSELVPPTKLSGALHLYGKAENRPGRKMGHVNYLGPKGPALLSQALQERKKFQL